SVPRWVSGCSIPPYLNCDGTAFSSAAFPALADILGGTTLPDARGRYRATLNQGQSRITTGTSLGGIDGNTLLASGGAQVTTLSSDNLPPVPITDPGHKHTITSSNGLNSPSAAGQAPLSNVNVGSTGTATTALGVTNWSTTGITAGSTSPANFSRLPPSYIGGITMIRSA